MIRPYQVNPRYVLYAGGIIGGKKHQVSPSILPRRASQFAQCAQGRYLPTELDDETWEQVLDFAEAFACSRDGGAGAAAPSLPSAEELAKKFHETYERLALQLGYETRKESAVAWEQVPDKTRTLMIATCSEVLAALSSDKNREK